MLDHDLVAREQARDVDERLAGHDDRTVTVDLRRQRGAQRELHVGGGELQVAIPRLEQDPREDLHGAAGGESTRDDAERPCELVLRTRNPQLSAHHDVCFNHLRNLS